jgi:rubredoxin
MDDVVGRGPAMECSACGWVGTFHDMVAGKPKEAKHENMVITSSLLACPKCGDSKHLDPVKDE